MTDELPIMVNHIYRLDPGNKVIAIFRVMESETDDAEDGRWSSVVWYPDETMSKLQLTKFIEASRQQIDILEAKIHFDDELDELLGNG